MLIIVIQGIFSELAYAGRVGTYVCVEFEARAFYRTGSVAASILGRRDTNP